MTNTPTATSALRSLAAHIPRASPRLPRLAAALVLAATLALVPAALALAGDGLRDGWTPATATRSPPAQHHEQHGPDGQNGYERSWAWPLSPRPKVLRGFDPPAAPWDAAHRGVDLHARPGQTIVAAGPGVVAFAGLVAGRGVVTVAHVGGLRTTYEPVRPIAAVGAHVRAGDPVATLEPGPGHCTVERVCLHWGLLRGGHYLNPLSVLQATPVRLLPVWEVPAPYVGRTGGRVARGNRTPVLPDSARGPTGGGLP